MWLISYRWHTPESCRMVRNRSHLPSFLHEFIHMDLSNSLIWSTYYQMLGGWNPLCPGQCCAQDSAVPTAVTPGVYWKHVSITDDSNGRKEGSNVWATDSKLLLQHLPDSSFHVHCWPLRPRSTEIRRLVMDCKQKNVISSTLNGLHFHFAECLLASETWAQASGSTPLTPPPLIIHSCSSSRV